MRKFNSLLVSIVMVSSIAVLDSCKSDEPTAEEIQAKKLMAKVWHIQTVKINGVDQTALFDEMKISFTADSFTVINGGLVWPTTGTWHFTENTALTIQRNDGTLIMIEELSESVLRLSLTWNETSFGPGRKNSISGVHVFSFN